MEGAGRLPFRPQRRVEIRRAGAEVCWVRKLPRRGYNAVPVEDLHSDRVAGIIPVCLG